MWISFGRLFDFFSDTYFTLRDESLIVLRGGVLGNFPNFLGKLHFWHEIFSSPYGCAWNCFGGR